jgi:hypothetical protein
MMRGNLSMSKFLIHTIRTLFKLDEKRKVVVAVVVVVKFLLENFECEANTVTEVYFIPYFTFT